jgi:phosphomannomutase
MQLTASIFKAYDIRGIVPGALNEAVAEALADLAVRREAPRYGWSWV